MPVQEGWGPPFSWKRDIDVCGTYAVMFVRVGVCWKWTGGIGWEVETVLFSLVSPGDVCATTGFQRTVSVCSFPGTYCKRLFCILGSVSPTVPYNC